MVAITATVSPVGKLDGEWDAAFRGPHDVYHTAGYHRFAEGCGEGTPWLAVVRSDGAELVWPYLLRPALDGGSASDGRSGDATDVTSVYGYPGPSATGCRPGDEFLARAFRELAGIWREQHAAAAFTRFHPLLENAALAPPDGDASELAGGSGVRPGGTTVSVDCSLSDEEAYASYCRPLRQHLRAARALDGRTIEDESWEHLPVFVGLYGLTMARNHSDARYCWGLDDFLRLRAELGPHLHLLMSYVADVPAAAGLFTEYAGIVQAHLVASDAAFKAISPTKLLLDDARQWARARGDSVLHLGGGRGGREDSLFRFKREFSPRRHSFFTGRWILDPEAYRDLAALRRASVPEGSALDEEYFPAYRAPILVQPANEAPETSPREPSGTRL